MQDKVKLYFLLGFFFLAILTVYPLILIFREHLSDENLSYVNWTEVGDYRDPTNQSFLKPVLTPEDEREDILFDDLVLAAPSFTEVQALVEGKWKSAILSRDQLSKTIKITSNHY